MLIPLRDIPRRERRLVFSSDPALRRRSRREDDQALLEALNRALAIHDESVDALWPADLFEPGRSAAIRECA